MTSLTSTITPRLRVSRHSFIAHDQSQVASTSDAGPSHLPELSQLVDVNLSDMETSEDQLYRSDQPSASRYSTKSSGSSKSNLADSLRALASRLPASPAKSYCESKEDAPERVWDSHMSESAHTTPSVAQESIRGIFSNALREQGDTPQKARYRRNSFDTSEVEASPMTEKKKSGLRGKRRSLSDDEADSYRTPTFHASRNKTRSQPITLEFLRERFSDSRYPHPPNGDGSTFSASHFNDDIGLLPDLPSSQTISPAATSTPQQSLRLLTNAHPHSNLLEEDSEMQHAIEGLSSYEDSEQPQVSPPPRLQKPSTWSSPSFGIDLGKTTRSVPSPLHAALRPGTDNRSNDDSRGNEHLEQDCQWNNPNRVQEYGSITKSASQFTSQQRFGSYSSDISMEETQLYRQQDDVEPLPQSGISHGSNNPHLSVSPVRRHQSFLSSRPISPSGPLLSSSCDEGTSHNREPEGDQQRPASSLRLNDGDLSQSPSLSSRSRKNSIRTPTYSNKTDDTAHQSNSNSTLTPKSGTYDEKRSSCPASPLREEQPSLALSGLAASQQNIDNTYRQMDGNRLNATRSNPSLYSSSRSQGLLGSPSNSHGTEVGPATWGKVPSLPQEGSATQSNTVVSSRRKNSELPPSPRVSLYGSMTLSGDSKRPREVETDEDLRETDLSSPSDSPLREVADHSQQLYEILPAEGGAASTQGQHDNAMSPDAPRHSTPSPHLKPIRSPSPPGGLPDLPTLSSTDDEKQTPAPQSRRHRDLRWVATPKPPGGWMATPKPPQTPRGSLRDSDSFRYKQRRPAANSSPWDDPTPPPKQKSDNRWKSLTQTPKPPGGWVATPNPLASRSQTEPSGVEIAEYRGLLTPAPSVPKGNSNPKTPAAPGAWTTTPATRKSILKVRFDPESPSLRDHPSNRADSPSATRENGLGDSLSKSVNEAADSGTPPPSRPHRPKSPTIHVVDAFGRQQPDIAPQEESKRNKGKLRVVDAMGREVDEPSHSHDVTDVADVPSRGELLSRIRRGLNELADDLEDDESLSFDYSHIEQLGAVSEMARRNRSQIYEQVFQDHSKHAAGQATSPVFGGLLSLFHSRTRLILFVVAIQLFFVIFMYRISNSRAKSLFLNAYYDPLNPEFHLYIFKSDTSLHLTHSASSRPFWLSLSRYGRAPRDSSEVDWISSLVDSFKTFIGNLELDIGNGKAHQGAWPPT